MNNLEYEYVKYIFIKLPNYIAVQVQLLYFRYYLKKRMKEYHHESMTLSLMTTSSFSFSPFPFLHNLSQLRKPRRRVHLAVASACLVYMFDFFFYIHSIS